MVELNATVNEIFNLLFASVDDEKANILIDRYLRDKTLQEIADEKGLTRERIRQIEARSIKVYFDFLIYRGYKQDMAIIFKNASSKLHPINFSNNSSKDYTYQEKYLFILRISTRFPDSVYKIDTHKSLNREFYSKKDFDFDFFINFFEEQYLTDRLNIIKNINSRFALNLDQGFIDYFKNIAQTDSPNQETLFEYKIKDFEETRTEKIERFFKNRGREASIEEIIEATGLSERQIRSAIDYSNKIVNIGKSVYGHIENGYKQGTTEELVLRFINANSPTTLFKIKRYISSERVVKESTVTVALMLLTKKGYIKKIDDEYYYISGIDETLFQTKPISESKTKSKTKVNAKKGVFKEIFRFKISESKDIVVSDLGESLWIGEFITTNTYNGPSRSGFALNKSDLDMFIRSTNNVLEKRELVRMKWKDSKDAELIIAAHEKLSSPGNYYIDIRQYLKRINFEGYTKKGIRMDEKVFREFFEELKSRKDLRL